MAGLGGRRRRRKWQLIVALGALATVLSTVYAVGQIIHGGLQPGDTAGVLALPLGVAGLVAAVMALRKQAEGNDAELARGWAATLAKQVEAGESAVWRQLLGNDNRRIDLTYVLHPAAARPATAPAAGHLIADQPDLATLPDIVTYYRSTQPLRLVVTGAAGAGKTVLVLELLLALIDGRDEDDPVPIRIPLSRWDTERQSLAELLQQRLTDDYGWPADLAAGLVRHHLVLPVLDGLDEMDPLAPGGSPDPIAPRATAVVNALNRYQQGTDAGPLVLTCRTRHYDALARHTVWDAARIAVAPVGTREARTYLTDRALDKARWQPLTDHLTACPGGLLATTLSTPWRLCLTATVYHRDGDPAELLALPGPDTLDRHLLARYIPAATSSTPNPSAYTPQDVHRWLHHLTTHLDPTGALHLTAPVSAEATDLVLHELWPLAGRARVRTTDVLLAILVVLAPLPLAWIAPQSPTGPIAAVNCALAVVAGVSSFPASSPSILKNPFSTRRGRRSLAAGLAAGLTAGLGVGITAGLTVSLGVGITAGLLTGLLAGVGVGVATGLTTELVGAPSPSLGARASIRNDALVGLMLGLAGGSVFGLAVGSAIGLTLGLTLGLALGLAGGSVFGLAVGSAIGLTLGLTLGLALGLAGGSVFGLAVGSAIGLVLGNAFGSAFGLSAGLAFGLGVGVPAGLAFGLARGLAGSARAARRYLVFLLCSRRRLPFRLGLFLDWAVTAGLMRCSGPTYQYRHRELQHWLRQHPQPPSAP